MCRLGQVATRENIRPGDVLWTDEEFAPGRTYWARIVPDNVWEDISPCVDMNYGEPLTIDYDLTMKEYSWSKNGDWVIIDERDFQPIPDDGVWWVL